MLTDGVKYKGASSFGNKAGKVFLSGAEVQLLRGDGRDLAWDDTGAVVLGRHDRAARWMTVGKAFFSMSITTFNVPEHSGHMLSKLGVYSNILLICRRRPVSLMSENLKNELQISWSQQRTMGI